MSISKDYAAAFNEKEWLEREEKQASIRLNAIRQDLIFAMGFTESNGITPDTVKAQPGFIKAKREYETAKGRLQVFNAAFLKVHGEQYREACQAAREAKLAACQAAAK